MPPNIRVSRRSCLTFMSMSTELFSFWSDVQRDREIFIGSHFLHPIFRQFPSKGDIAQKRKYTYRRSLITRNTSFRKRRIISRWCKFPDRIISAFFGWVFFSMQRDSIIFSITNPKKIATQFRQLHLRNRLSKCNFLASFS